MTSKLSIVICLLALLLAPAGIAQDADTPTVAILRFGPLLSANHVEDWVTNGLHRMGVVSQEEYAQLLERQDLEGERINIIWGDAQFDHASAQTLVDSVLDREVDAIVAISTPVTAATLNATADLENAPAVIFGEVHAPYHAGIAQAPCVKPANLTGIAPETPYDEILPLLLLQDPALETIGTIYSLNEVSGVVGAEQIKQLAEEFGLTVLESGVNTVSDLALAAEAMVERGAEALLIPADYITLAGMPIIMQTAVEHSIPVFHSTSGGMMAGATVGAGTAQYEWQGTLIAAILVGHLRGELDVARVGIGAVSDLTIGVNLDMAQAQELVIAEPLLDLAVGVVKDGVLIASGLVEKLTALGLEGKALQTVMTALQESGVEAALSALPPEAQKLFAEMSGSQPDASAAVGNYLATMRCTDEMIAEQQAQLDAADA